MRSNIQPSINLKTILLCFTFFIFLLILVVRTSLTPPSAPTQISKSINSNPQEARSKAACPSIPLDQTCAKLTPSLASALTLYATSKITPQQTFAEVSVTKRVLDNKSPCNFLVFGLGHDSLMWAALNHGGRTLFVEEDNSWIRKIKKKFQNLEAHHVIYSTKVKEAERLMEIGNKTEECKVVTDPRKSRCALVLKTLPREVYETEWDLIMVDAPTGFHDEAPGRMSAIYTAGLMARNREEGETEVFVHDVDRFVEDKFSLGFLCKGYLTEQVGRLRRFTVPSHRTRSGRPFCPVV